jgi:glycosyltransferase involved in cell wall biosynthesis
MESERRGLLILFEGFPPTVIRSQVISLVAWLARERLIHFDILSIACSKGVFAQGRGELKSVIETVRQVDPKAGVTLLRGMRPAFPGATLYNRHLVRGHINQRWGRYCLLHARTDYAASIVAPLGRANKIPLVWDCRGDASAEFLGRAQQQNTPQWLAQRRAASLLTQARRAADSCSGAIFVSSALHQRWQSHIRGPAHVIPTLADGDRFCFSAELRARARQELGIASDERVYVYSGTLSAYQGFADAVRTFQHALKEGPHARLLVLTPSVGQGQALLAQLPAAKFLLKSVDFRDMNRMLNAADFALLTRPPSAINRAAFPTKFAEYGLAGLPVIMSDATPDCVTHAQQAGNYLPMALSTLPACLDANQRTAVSEYYRRALTAENFRAQYAELYSLAGKTEA